jgi:hypothetical protein
VFTNVQSEQLGKGDNIFEWAVSLIVLNPDSYYYGGYFKVNELVLDYEATKSNFLSGHHDLPKVLPLQSTL